MADPSTTTPAPSTIAASPARRDGRRRRWLVFLASTGMMGLTLCSALAEPVTQPSTRPCDPVMTLVRPRLDPKGTFAQRMDVSANQRLRNFPRAAELGPQDDLTQGDIESLVKSWTRMTSIYLTPSVKGGYDNEHLPKWISATALAARRTGDPQLRALAIAWADQVVAAQGPDGYLGTFVPENRFTDWDAWGQNYMLRALLDVQALAPEKSYTDALARGAECLAAGQFRANGDRRAQIGGLSAQWFMGVAPAIPRSLRGPETGRALETLYQRVVTDEVPDPAGIKETPSGGLRKYYEETQIVWAGLIAGRDRGDDARARTRAFIFEQKMADAHRSPTGALWGDFEASSRLPASLFYRMEVCGMLVWNRLEQEMLAVTGDARYAENIELLMCNAALGAMHEKGYKWVGDGHPWITHQPGGLALARGNCCASSGPILLEELPLSAGGMIGGSPAVNLFLPGRIEFPDAARGAAIEIQGDLTSKGACDIHVLGGFGQDLLVRAPTWLEQAELHRAGKVITPPVVRGYWRIAGPFQANEEIRIQGTLPLGIVALPYAEMNEEYYLKEKHAPPTDNKVPLISGGYVRRGPIVYGVLVPRALLKPEKPIRGRSDLAPADWDRVAGGVLPAGEVLDAQPIAAPSPYQGPAFTWKSAAGEFVLLPYWQVPPHDTDGIRVLLKREGGEGAALAPLTPPILVPAGGRGTLQVNAMQEAPRGAPRPEHAEVWTTFTLDGSEPRRDSPRWAGAVTVKPGECLKARRFTRELASEVRRVEPVP